MGYLMWRTGFVLWILILVYGLSAQCMRGCTCGILVGKCHFVWLYCCYEVGYVKRYGLCYWYGMWFWGWYYDKKDWWFFVSWGYKVNMTHVLVVVVVVVGESFVDDYVGFCDICALSFTRRAWRKALAFALCWIVFHSFCLCGGVGGNWFILLGRNR